MDKALAIVSQCCEIKEHLFFPLIETFKVLSCSSIKKNSHPFPLTHLFTLIHYPTLSNVSCLSKAITHLFSFLEYVITARAL